MDSILPPEIRAFIGREVGTSAFEVQALAGDASSRKYYRVIFDEHSRVLMSWEPFADAAEYPFLNVATHFAKAGVRVPKVEATSPELGVILLEDLGDLTLERKFWENQNQDTAMPFYDQAVDELIRIHFAASVPTEPLSLCQRTRFDTAKFMWEMNYAREHFLEKLGHVRLSERDQQTLTKEFTGICERLDQQPKFVAHRDYHSRNLMLKLGRVYVIDFQDARLGPVQYDLVSLVHDSYVDLSPQSIAHVKERYVTRAREVGPKGVIRDDFDEIFRLQLIQRCFKACGSFASFYNQRGDTRYLKYIRNTLHLVAHAVAEHGGLPMFQSALAGEDLLERSFDAPCAG